MTCEFLQVCTVDYIEDSVIKEQEVSKCARFSFSLKTEKQNCLLCSLSVPVVRTTIMVQKRINNKMVLEKKTSPIFSRQYLIKNINY